jgi:hypothetical protein
VMRHNCWSNLGGTFIRVVRHWVGFDLIASSTEASVLAVST